MSEDLSRYEIMLRFSNMCKGGWILFEKDGQKYRLDDVEPGPENSFVVKIGEKF